VTPVITGPAASWWPAGLAVTDAFFGITDFALARYQAR